jgi:Flp pilus assembly secretin CpaC
MKAKKLISILGVLGAVLINPSTCFADQKPPLYLSPGEQRFLPLSSTEKYSVSGSAIRYTRLPRQNRLLIKAVSPGTSSLVITRSDDVTVQVIRVEAKPDIHYPKPMLQALNLLESTEAIDGGTKMILRGEVRNPKEALAIAQLKQSFPQHLLDETTIAPNWFEQNKSEISYLLKDYPLLEMRAEPGMIHIQGPVVSASIAENLKRRVRLIQPLVEFDLQTTSGYSPTLYFKVFLLEVQKEFSSRLGVEINQPFPLQSVFSQSLNGSIHAMSERGLVRVLSAPELVVKAPGQAELFAGGELPIRLKSRFNETLIWKNIGLALKLDVKEYNGEKVRLTIETELNHQNDALTLESIPGIKTNRIKTVVESKMGKPLLLSGLLQEDTFEKVRGIYGISHIPVLGKLFGSEDFQQNRSELVAILLPHREPPKEPMQRISSGIPKGPLPVARNHIPASELETLKQSKDYPWNVL